MHNARCCGEYKGSDQDNSAGDQARPDFLIGKLLNKSIKHTAVIVFGICVALAIFKSLNWAGGFLVGALWAIAELVLTFKVLEIALLKDDKRKLLPVLLIKFPLLYLFGILILISKIFPLASLLLGLLPIFIVMGIVRLCTPNFRI